MLAAINHRALRWIAVLYGLGSALDWALGMALMVFVYERTGSPAAAGAMLICSQVAPAAFLALLGRRVDRWRVKPTLAAAFLLQGLSVLSLVVLSLPVYAVAVLVGLFGALVRAELRAGLCQAAGGELVREGSALLNAIRGVTSLFGPAAGAASLAAFGVSSTLGAVGLLLISGAALTALLPRLAAEEAVQVGLADVQDAADRAEPVDRPVGPLLALVAVTIVALSIDEPILLAYIEHDLAAGVGGYGALLTAWGIGMLVGTAIFARLVTWPMLRVFVLAAGISGAAHLGLVVAPSLAPALVAAVIGGVAGGMDWAALSTAVLERAPQGREASVAARLEAVATAAPGVGFLAGGLLAAAVEPHIVLAIPAAFGALVVVAACAYALISRRHALRVPTLPLTPEATPRGA